MKMYKQGSSFRLPIEAYLRQCAMDSDVDFNIETLKKIINSIKNFYDFNLVKKDTNRNVIWMHFENGQNNYKELIEFADWINQLKNSKENNENTPSLYFFEPCKCKFIIKTVTNTRAFVGFVCIYYRPKLFVDDGV